MLYGSVRWGHGAVLKMVGFLFRGLFTYFFELHGRWGPILFSTDPRAPCKNAFGGTGLQKGVALIGYVRKSAIQDSELLDPIVVLEYVFQNS